MSNLTAQNIPQDVTPPRWRGARDVAAARAFLDYLESRGTLDPMGRERAATVQAQTGERIDLVLSQLGLMSDATLLDALAQFCQLPIVSLETSLSEPQAASLLALDFLSRHRIVPLALDDDRLTLAVADPFAQDVVDAVAYLVERPVEVLLATEKAIDLALSRLCGKEDGDGSEFDETALTETYEDDVQRLRDMASQAPIVRLVHRLITSAISQHASDVHIEPLIDCVRVRYRIDGVMHEVERLAPDVQAGVATRIKIVGKLNIAERRLPQDGRAKFIAAGREVDLRISTTPVLHGESIVVRILDTERMELSFDALGFDRGTQDTLNGILSRPNGIILVTGPTGSGKTTTLYSALKQLNCVERKIFTVEDPVEYQQVGINQMQIKPDIGLDFVNCLRSILRQDPDIIMIGEMRDPETVSTAIRASLTGHLVLSTLHTNSASASVARLLDMGAEDYLLASSISCVLAQRLVRRLCPECAVPLPDSRQSYEELLRQLDDTGSEFSNNLRAPVGCPKCSGNGFRGRTAIYEMLLVNDDVRHTIKHGMTDREMEAVACRSGMETLHQCGIRKALAGETTLDEVLRVARS